MRYYRVTASIAFSVISFCNTHASDFRGQVIDSISKLSIEGASVTSSNPANAYIEFSDTFGFFSSQSVVDGVYTTRVFHPGYITLDDTNTITSSSHVNRVYELTPAFGGEGAGFDIYFQITDASSGIGLSDVPIGYERFELASDIIPTETRAAVTDVNGFTIIRGSRTGFYRFEANLGGSARPRWEAFTTSGTADDKTNLMKTHMANIMLKPGPLQDFDILVKGYDPQTDTPDTPLKNIYVEIEGLDPAFTDSVVLPARTGLTDTNGAVIFKGLAALPMRITAKKMGYLKEVITITPVPATGDLLPNPLEIDLTFIPNVVEIEVVSPYIFPVMMEGLSMKIMGLKNTETEGIERESITSDTGSEVKAIFPSLPPGRYRALVKGTLASPGISSMTCETPLSFGVDYSGETFFEVEGDALTIVTLPLDVAPATVHIRLFAADEQGSTATQLENDGDTQPIYTLMEQSGIFLIEELPESLLEPMARTNEVATGPDGEVTFKILPGSYGVIIPSMTNYTGFETLYLDEVADIFIGMGWPYYDWPVSFDRDPDRHSCGLIFNSYGEYRIDLFVNSKLMNIGGDIDGDPAVPTAFRILANPVQSNEYAISYSEIANNSGSMRLEGTNGISLTNSITDLTAVSTGPLASYEFLDIPAGTYDIWLDHARHTSPTDTLTVIGWNAPGVIPPVDPGLPDHNESFSTLTRVPYTPAYMPSDTATLSVYATNAIGGYDLISTIITLDVVRPTSYATNSFFSAAGLMPESTFELWQNFPPNGWYHVTTSGTVVADVFINGPSNNVIPFDSPPIPGYRLNVIATSADDPDLNVAGSMVTLLDGDMLTTPGLIPFHTNSLTPSVVVDTKWTWLGTHETTIESLEPPEFTVNLWMKRSMGVSGRVVRADNTNIPISNAQVILRDRFGNILRHETTDSNGYYVVGTAIKTFQTIFADVSRSGYLPWRKRFVPDPDAGSTDLVVNASITPAPGPVIESVSLNRYGIFLPGVKKSGDKTLFHTLDADAPLTMTWTAKVTQAVFTNMIPHFDNPDGSTGTLETIIVTDSVVEVWLIDQRYFPTNNFSDDPVFSPVISPTNGYGALKQWVFEENSKVFSNRFMRFSGGGITNGMPNGIDIVGQIKIWNLPIDSFDPSVLVFTKHGAIALFDYTYPIPTNQHTLRGLRLPPWMATLSDVIGVVSATQATQEQLKDILPSGRFEALPSFTTSITEIDDGSPTGFILYSYEMGVDWNEGMDSLASGILALGPGTLGLSFEGKANLAVNGLSGSATFGVSADIKTGDIELTDMLPKVLSSYAEPTVTFQIGAETTVSNNFTASQPIEFELTHEVGGGVNSTVKANLRPVLGKIPYVGPVLVALDKTEGLQFFGVLQGGVGQVSEVSWRTLYPPANDAVTGTTNINHVLRRHFLGGKDEEIILKQKLCFQFGVGLDVLAAGGRAGASGRLLLQGDECGRQPAPSASVELNQFGDWPPVSRVTGNATAIVEAFLKAWVIDVGKTWEWELIKFDIQFGTDPVFQLIPMNVTGSRISPATSTAAEFEGEFETPTIVDNFYPAGSYRAVGGASDAFVFTQTDPGSGSMSIQISLRTGTVWNAPASLTVTGGVISLDVKQKPLGGWMMVWNSISTNEVGNPYPMSQLYYATSDIPGTVWSSPNLIANLNGAAANLKLVCSANDMGLFSLETDGGPLSTDYTLRGRRWFGTSWVLESGSSTNLTIYGCDAAGTDVGPTPRYKFVYLNATGSLRAISWNGFTFQTNALITNGVNNAISLASDTNGNFCVAWSAMSGGIGLSICDTNSQWTNIGIVVSNAIASEVDFVALTGTNTTRYLLTWIEGGDVSSIWYAFLSKTGTLERLPENLTANLVGKYHDVQLIPGTGATARIVSQYTGNPAEIREFTLSFDNGASDNDLDGDGFNDLQELVIIDASTNDAINSITNVLPSGDFDMDGLSNQDEFNLGFDPTDGNSFPYIDEIAITNNVELWFLTGTGTSHKIQSSTNLLDSTNWKTVATTDGDGAFQSVLDTNASEAFKTYRLQIPDPSP